MKLLKKYKLQTINCLKHANNEIVENKHILVDSVFFVKFCFFYFSSRSIVCW